MIDIQTMEYLMFDLNIEFIDATNFISNRNCHKEWIFTDRIHLTDLGYKYMAELILPKL